MKRLVRKYDSFEAAEQADSEYYAGLNSEDRLDILLTLIERYRKSIGESADRFERVHRTVELSRS